MIVRYGHVVLQVKYVIFLVVDVTRAESAITSSV